MAVHPNSLKNLKKGKKFCAGDPRIGRGKVAGTLDRKTRFKEWLEMEADCKDPAGNMVQLPLIDKVILAMINKATQGNVAAANMVLEGMYGKRDEEAEEAMRKQTFNWDAYTEEEIDQLIALLAKGTPDNIVELPNAGE